MFIVICYFLNEKHISVFFFYVTVSKINSLNNIRNGTMFFEMVYL